MAAEERRRLTWEDATERFLDVAELKPGERPKGIEEAADQMAWKAFNAISGELPNFVAPVYIPMQSFSRLFPCFLCVGTFCNQAKGFCVAIH